MLHRPGDRSIARCGVLAAIACTVACESPSGLTTCLEPMLSRAAVIENPTNVLSGVVTADVRLTDSVMVRFGVDVALDSATPAFTVTGDSVRALVLGLTPSTAYRAQLVAFNRCGTTTSDVLAFTTGALPPDLPTYTAEGSSPSGGYVVFGAGKYGLAIDNTGRVVWYHRFPNGPGLNFQPQPNGHYSARPPSEAGSPPTWVELAPDGRITRTFGCAHGLVPRMHDAIVELDGSYWLLCDEVRTLDLSAQGGPTQAPVLGTGVQQRNAAGDVLFEWSPFDHLEVDLNVLEPADRSANPVNWTHGNALDLDFDGNLFVSFRNLSEVTKIDTRTGAVMWRLGGRQNQFAFENAAVPGFARQHGLRVTSDDRGILLLDNLGEPAGSRAERYELDFNRRTVRLSGAFGSPAGLVAQLGGNVQPLGGGHLLVSFGSGGGVEEYDRAGNVVWKLTGNPGYIFRAERVQSLYRPGAGDPR